MSAPIYVLGGAQTDFARNWAREGLTIYDMFRETLDSALASTGISPDQIEVGHVGNFVGDLFTGQGLIGGFFAEAYPELASIPTSRHEAACASGSIAVLSAMRDIEAGHYDVAAVLGLEYMRNVDGQTGAEYLGAATWKGVEATNCDYPWPYMFNQIIDEYDARHGINCDHLKSISKINFDNGRRNPNAQTRAWQFKPENYAADNGLRLQDIPRIKGWGHRSAPISLDSKLKLSAGNPLIFPHVSQIMTDALGRAGFDNVTALDGLETHDCFSITEYMAIDHIGLTAPGESWKAIQEGRISMDGDFPINASGGLIGLGHPVGATGIRMLLDCANQVTGRAGACQIKDAENMATFNLGGSTTTCVSLIVGVN